MSISEVTTDQSSSPSIQILQKAKLVEINMGLRNVMGDYEGSVLEKQWMEVLISVLEFSDRNTQLLLIDQLINLLLSECIFSLESLSLESLCLMFLSIPLFKSSQSP